MKNGDTEIGNVLTPKVVYHPEYKENQIVKFRKFVENKYNIHLKDYWELHEWSYKNYPEFWDCVWLYFDILYTSPYKQVFDKKNGFLNAKWFEGLRFNYAANILKYRDSRTALIAVDDEDNTQSLTYSELYDEVRVYIKALKDAGVRKGDVVTCYSPNKLEPVLAFLATAAIGATWSGGLPLLGAKGILARFQQINPKILFTAGNFFFENTEIRMDQKVPEVVKDLPSLEKVVFIPSKLKGKLEDISKIPKCVLLSDFLADARRSGDDEDGEEISFEQVPFDHPLCVSFTSGTTGAPKGLVHSAGMFLASLRDYGLQQDCTRDDILFNFSPVGWISWHMFVNCLHLGVTLVMYEGGGAFEGTRFFDLVDRFGITSSYIWSSTVEDMERRGHAPNESHSLKTLKQIFPMGSPAKPHSFDYLTEKVKQNIFCTPVYGCTEVFGLISGLDSNLPVHKGEIQLISLGMDVRILNEEGRPVIGERGNLVLANPYPASMTSLLNDNKGQDMMRELYLSQYPGYWCVGDDVWMNPTTKGLIVYGRSDETMNPNGARFNCSEIYFALEGFPGILDSVCVSQFNDRLDERVVLFVKMMPGCPFTREVGDAIKETIERHLSVEHVPALVLETPDIPYNLTGKKLNGLVKKIINKRAVTNAEIVLNPASIEYFKTVDLGIF